MIIAVDFDGVLCEDKFPSIGKPRTVMIAMIKCLIEMGHEVVLWTSRTDKELDNAVEWCLARDLKFTSINKNTPSNIKKYQRKYPNGTRKVYADVYIDDHNIQAVLGDVSLDYYVYRLLKTLEGENK